MALGGEEQEESPQGDSLHFRGTLHINSKQTKIRKTIMKNSVLSVGQCSRGGREGLVNEYLVVTFEILLK